MTRTIFATHASTYGHLNWQIFPLAPGAKVPIAGSAGLRDASANRAQIEMWCRMYPHANIGLRCGQDSGVIVLDFDPRNGSVETVARLAKEGKAFPDTVESATPSDGRHRYYAYDLRVAISGSNKLGAGIDISTDGHYVVLPPSYWGKADKHYKWMRPPCGTDFTPLPKWVINMLVPKTEPKRQPLQRIDYAKMDGYRRQAMSDLDRAVQQIAGLQDGRHEAPFRVACRVGKYQTHGFLTSAEIERAILNASASNGALSKYALGDLTKQIANGLRRSQADSLPPLARIHREQNR